MRPGFHGNMCDESALNCRASAGGYLCCESLVLVTAEINQLDSFTIICDFKRVRMFQPPNLLDGVGPQLRSDLVFSVDGEVVLNQHAAPCSQWQALDMISLSQIHQRRKCFRRWRRLIVPWRDDSFSPSAG